MAFDGFDPHGVDQADPGFDPFGGDHGRDGGGASASRGHRGIATSPRGSDIAIGMTPEQSVARSRGLAPSLADGGRTLSPEQEKIALISRWNEMPRERVSQQDVVNRMGKSLVGQEDDVVTGLFLDMIMPAPVAAVSQAWNQATTGHRLGAPQRATWGEVFSSSLSDRQKAEAERMGLDPAAVEQAMHDRVAARRAQQAELDAAAGGPSAFAGDPALADAGRRNGLAPTQSEEIAPEEGAGAAYKPRWKRWAEIAAGTA